MPRKVPAKKTMFDIESDANSRPKIPTLRQYLKGDKAHGLASVHSVEIIWFPGDYDNYTFQTKDFRASISSSSALYAALSTDLDEFTRGTKGLEVTFDEVRRGIYTLRPSTTDGEWFFIGETGIRFEPSTPVPDEY